MGDYLGWTNGVMHWDVFNRSVQDWEVGTLYSFMGLLYSSKSVRGKEDCMRWTLPRQLSSLLVCIIGFFLLLMCRAFLGEVFGVSRPP